MHRRSLTFRRPTISTPPRVEAMEARRMLSAFMIKDVNTAPPIESTPVPAAFVEVNNVLLFGAPDGADRVLYRSDGTPGGTAPLHPVSPGTEPGVRIGNVAYFAGTTLDGGAELWKTDGTAAGTARVKDILPGAGSSSPKLLTAAGGRLYFTAYHPDYGEELWKSDGTAAGTVLAAETLPGPSSRTITEIQPADGTVYFATRSDMTGFGGLYQTDGTPAGTTLVLQSDVTPSRLEALGSRLVFLGYDAAHGQEPWVTDGTPGGTRMLKDINPFGGSADNSFSIDAFRFGDDVYFSAKDDPHGLELWKTDGTPEGTVLVKDLLPGFNGSDPRDFVSTGGVMYFIAGGPTGGEVWRSDGTEAGTTIVKEGVNASQLIVSGSSLYFAGPREGWKSDGTTAGTVLLRQFNKYPYGLAPYRGGVAFQGDDGPRWEPWFSNGTPQGTVMLGDFDRRTLGSVTPPASPTPVSLGDKVVFIADAGHAGAAFGQLWVTDGTTGGTTRLSDVTGVRYLTQMGDVAYFFAAAFQQDVRRLWRTDGTPEGTRPVLDEMFTHGQPAVVGNALYFGARLFAPGSLQPVALYRSDGTAQGTTRVAVMPDGSGIPENITPIGNTVYFTHSTSTASFALLKSDGTEAGTVSVRHFPNTGTIDGLAEVAGRLFFRTLAAMSSSAQVWASDGTSAGTISLGTFRTIGPSNNNVPIVSFGGAAYFAAAPVATPADFELWRSDGTPAGTARLTDIYQGTIGSQPRGLTVFDGRLYFSAEDAAAGRELWSTNGTEGGTSRLLDLLPGAGSSFPTPWGVIDGRLYFTANDGSRGFEMWSTDGTAAGTALLHDVHPSNPNPGVPPLAPVPLSNNVVGDRVLFWADDGVHGIEPWSAPPPGSPTSDFVVGRHLFYNNSRWDGRTEGASRSDDGAIAPDKAPLFPGGVAGFENVSGYSRGLNGVMIDVNTRLPGSTDVVISFQIGTGAPSSPWVPAPTPLAIERRNAGLPKDIDRFTVIWPDGAIRNKWLRVTIEAMSEGVVVGRDEFYFGHLAGETGDAAPPGLVAAVGAGDWSRTRAAASRQLVGLSNRFDHNRDGLVNVLDVNVVRANLFATLPPPTYSAVATSGSSPAPGKSSTRYRPAVWAALEA